MHINRYWNFGLSFRWVHGDNFVSVKRGYVIEGRSVFATRPVVPGLDIQSLPYDKVGEDQDTWVASFKLNARHWTTPYALNTAADKWAQEHPQIAELHRIVRYPARPRRNGE